MNNQENKNKEGIDLSQFPIKERKESVNERKHFSLENFKESWRRMGKKNRILFAIIIPALVLMIILLISLFSGRGSKETGPTPTTPQYTPPAEYLPSPGEKYTPPFP
ncbi:MAG: hypothetical protein ACTSRS_22530 [Candidatus Helarchaeota archaeon]